MNAKKILFVANVGKEHVLKFHVPTIREFTEQGWIVDVACAGDEEVPYCHRQYHMVWERSPFTKKTFDGIKQLKQILKEEHYDIIYCHTPVGGLTARLASSKARKQGTKVIYCAHGFHFYDGAPRKNWLIYYSMEKFLTRYTDVVFTVNQEDYENAKQRFSKRVEVRLVPEVGVDFTRLQIENKEEVRRQYRADLDIPEDAYVMIYVAELIPNKNQGMLIDTLKLLREQGMNAFLLLPGPDHAGGVFQEYAEQQNMTPYCRFLGWRSDIGELMYTSDICTASSIREGFGINLVEAMYCGLPVVATGNRGHKMIIKEGINGYTVEPGDSLKMAEYVKKILTDYTIAPEVLQENIEDYDCRRVAKELVQLIGEYV